jgi:hypothetical protein
MVIDDPIAPEAGIPVMAGPLRAGVKPTPLLGEPPTATTTGPLTAPAGTVVKMLVALQLPLATVACAPPKVTVLVPCTLPKFTPQIVTGVPTAPEVGEIPHTTGAPPLGFVTVKLSK